MEARGVRYKRKKWNLCSTNRYHHEEIEKKAMAEKEK